MAGRIKVGLVGIGNCFSGLIQGIEYYRKNPSQEVTGIIHDKLAGYGIHDIDFVCGFDVGEKLKLENLSMKQFMNTQTWSIGLQKMTCQKLMLKSMKVLCWMELEYGWKIELNQLIVPKLLNRLQMRSETSPQRYWC